MGEYAGYIWGALCGVLVAMYVFNWFKIVSLRRAKWSLEAERAEWRKRIEGKDE